MPLWTVWLPGWVLHVGVVAPQLAQLAPISREIVTFSDAAVAFAALAATYLARQVMQLKEQIGPLSSLPASVQRIEEHIAKISNTQSAQRVEIVNLQDDVGQNRQKLDQCPYHGDERRRPMLGERTHE